MRIVVAYITVTGGSRTDIYSARFASSYMAFPPGVEHETIVICNGGPPTQQIGVILAGLPNLRFFPRSNSGWDIAGYVEAAKGPAKDADMIVCLGESVYFHRAEWLRRLADVWYEFGEGMYGIFASHVVRAHLNTTAFVTSPKILADYPARVENRNDRYEFEHGRMALWRILNMEGKPTMLVTWDGVWPPGQWRQPVNILWRGDQTNCLAWCNHVESYRESSPKVRGFWQRHVDAPFS